MPPPPQFQKHKPYIASPVFPSTIHKGDLLNISVGIVYDSVISSGVNVTIGSSQYPMASNSPSGLYRIWTTSINTSTFPLGVTKFKIVAGTLSTNDNDQRMFEVRIVDDAGSGRDAGSGIDSAVVLGLNRSGSLLVSGARTGFLLQSYGDSADYFKFPIRAGNGYRISYDPSLVSLRVFEVDDYGREHGRVDYVDSGVVAGYNGSVFFGLYPKSALFAFLNYSFSVSVSDSANWTDNRTAVRDYFTPKRFGGFSIQCGCSEGICCSGYRAASLSEVSVSEAGADLCPPGIEVWYVGPNNQSIDGLVGVALNPNSYIYSGKDVNGVSVSYFDVLARIYYPSSCSGSIVLNNIFPAVGLVDRTSDRLPISVAFVPGSQSYFRGRVPVYDSDGDYVIYMKLDYAKSGSSYVAKVSDPFVYRINVVNTPTLYEFRSFSGYDVINLAVNASDVEGLNYAEFFVDNVSSGCGRVSFSGKVASCNWSTTSKVNGSKHTAYVIVNNTDGGWFRSKTIDLIVRNDNSVPVINSTYINPTSKGSVLNNSVRGVVSLDVLAYDAESGISRVSWYVNNTLKITNSSFVWDTQNLYGTQNIRVEVFDRPLHSASKTFIVKADNSPPAVTIVKPSSGQTISGTAYLEANVSDPSGIESVDWYLNINGKKVKVGSGARTYWGCGGLNADYTLSVNVSDYVGNTRSVDVPVSIRSPDLSVQSVSFTPSVPVMGVNNLIRVSIKNVGGLAANGIYLKYYEGYDESNASLISGSLSPGQTTEVLLNWTPKNNGLRNLTVVADPADYISEPNESNNYLSVAVNVGGSQ